MIVVRADCPAMPCGGDGWCRLWGLFVLSNMDDHVVVVVLQKQRDRDGRGHKRLNCSSPHYICNEWSDRPQLHFIPSSLKQKIGRKKTKKGGGTKE
jgi:hypothetical protein